VSGYNPGFDISPNFEADLAFGHKGEESIKDFLQSLISNSSEVKTDRYRNGRMVVETDQNPYNRGWKKSGINVTTAQWWVYIYSLGEAFVIVSVDRLKRYLRANPSRFNENTKGDFARNSDNPTRGFLLEPDEVMDMLYSNKYD
jgi:hypothetical protein